MPDEFGPPVFRGVHELLKLVLFLRRRPRFLPRVSDMSVHGDIPLPLIQLAGPEESVHGFLLGLRDELEKAEPRTPYVLIDAAALAPAAPAAPGAAPAPEAPAEPPELVLLDHLCRRLQEDRFAERPNGFRRYRLARWLTRHTLEQPGLRDPQSEIVGILRRWRGEPSTAQDAAQTQISPQGSNTFSTAFLTGGFWLLRLGLIKWLGRRSYGIVPEARWFMRRQTYMVPRHSSDFFGFAERLTAGRLTKENEDQLHKLLVHAFLEDLRQAYRRRRLSVLPRRRGWRRTAYVPVLIGHATAGNGGVRLMSLINDVRNETGELDPLLVIAGRRDDPAAEGQTKLYAPASNTAYTNWKKDLPVQRQKLAADARFLTIHLREPLSPSAIANTSGEDPDAWADLDLNPGRPSLLARRGVLEVLLVAALVAVAALPAARWADYWRAGCSYLKVTADSGIAVRLAEVGPGDRQCVGFSDNEAQIFGSNERLEAAQREVFRLNAEAAVLHGRQPGRPLISIVYFAGLTHAGADLETDNAVAEELIGLAIVQRQQNLSVTGQNEPLLRVIIANGGRGMSVADQVTRDMLIPLAERDPSVKAVVGLDRTVPQTRQAIADLGRAAVPTIATTLTGSGLADASKFYFQMVSGNPQQAQLIAAYLKHLTSPKVELLTIVRPAPGGPPDDYVDTLVAELTRAVAGIATAEVVELPGGAALKPCTSADPRASGQSRMYFYAGRETGYAGFLQAIKEDCAVETLPRIVADDAITRMVAQPAFRQQSYVAEMDLDYVALGSLVVLAGRSCPQQRTPAAPLAGKSRLVEFCAGYFDLIHDESSQLFDKKWAVPSYPGERVGVAYDTADLVITAARQAGPAPWNRAWLAQLFRDREFAHVGASGRISFADSRVGANRNIAILRLPTPANAAEAADTTPHCLFLIGELYGKETATQQAATGCPTG
ncbi:hypothetical protein SAMN05421541_104289 [Actinoplanes philippinensis]|uniref:ABC-type branched-chain amino acid transport system, substrate-binding protein n=1 Tax=Actinoplanes philippinensis TaxID=35752 RepID=A0A1I2E9T2_9ACTN|nr:hypothetical protein [Actinoplanes philippinensis]SFE89447.1 hypothetical protein SAMN05421541_104289 [Actinoplanes philippinensis]